MSCHSARVAARVYVCVYVRSAAQGLPGHGEGAAWGVAEEGRARAGLAGELYGYPHPPPPAPAPLPEEADVLDARAYFRLCTCWAIRKVCVRGAGGGAGVWEDIRLVLVRRGVAKGGSKKGAPPAPRCR